MFKIIPENRKKFYWYGIIVGYILPFLILSFKFNMFETYTTYGTKLKFWAIVGLLFLVVKLWSDLKKYFDDMDFGWFRSIVLGIMTIGPWLLLLSTTFIVQYFASNYIYVIRTITICQLCSVPFVTIHEKLDKDRKKARGDVRVIK